MTTLTIPVPATLAAGEIVAAGVSAEDYLAQYAETFHEWVEGVVIKMSPVTRQHDALCSYLRVLFAAYFELKPIGRVLGEPFVMRLDAIQRMREPDLQIILNDNPGELTDTVMIGPADICIEVVSAESVERDYGAKFNEYEKAGVREYWIIDPLRRRCDFNRRSEDGVYVKMEPDDTGHFRTPLLPKLVLHVPTLWQSELPGVIATGQAVQQMLAAE
jgi:Uma2 family endonuclease